jgi:hypothetical protein
MSKPKLAIVIGSIRANRFGGHAAQWIEEIARRRTDFEVELIDLKDYPMPLFAEEASPLYAPSKNEVAQRWQKTRSCSGSRTLGSPSEAGPGALKTESLTIGMAAAASTTRTTTAMSSS